MQLESSQKDIIWESYAQNTTVDPVNKYIYQPIRNSILERVSNDEILRYFEILFTLNMNVNNMFKMKEFIKENGR